MLVYCIPFSHTYRLVTRQYYCLWTHRWWVRFPRGANSYDDFHSFVCKSFESPSEQHLFLFPAAMWSHLYVALSPGSLPPPPPLWRESQGQVSVQEGQSGGCLFGPCIGERQSGMQRGLWQEEGSGEKGKGGFLVILRLWRRGKYSDFIISRLYSYNGR